MSFVPSALWRYWVACVLCALTAGVVWGQSAPTSGKLTRDDRELVADMTLNLGARGHAQIYFDIGPQQDTGKAVDWRRLPDEKLIAHAVEQAIGGTLRH